MTFRYKDYRRNGQRAVPDHDARSGRVHPPLPAPRAAEGLPPHPPLWPARQRRPQGQHRARSRTSRRAPARGRMQRIRRCRCCCPDRLATAMPVLRRQDDRHRDLRARRPRPSTAVGRLYKRGPRRHDGAPPITAHHPCRETSSSQDGRLARLRPPTPTSQLTTPKSPALQRATPQHARHRRGSLARQHDHCHPPAASVRPQRTKHKRQIPIAPRTALSIPRVPSLEAFGRRPRRQAITSMAGIRNPSQHQTFAKAAVNVASWTACGRCRCIDRKVRHRIGRANNEVANSSAS